MTIELSASSLRHAASGEEIQSVLTQAGKVGELLFSKGATIVTRTADESTLEAIKRFKSYKIGKKALKAKIARLREQPIRTERDRSSGYRRKRP